ncbi:hypothetical protein QQF64_021165 [Cirrhinus molitorella]|uniref:CG-1 domain-containing protein n=1 Tax=Cirrhinus molitorella TaxID=172907 RepID=A0ABR3LB70_9TELE
MCTVIKRSELGALQIHTRYHYQPEGSGMVKPQNGSMILYNRKKVKYRKDGYCWKKRKDGKTTREDHMKLKVQGVEVRPFVRAVVHTNPSTLFEIVGVQIMGTLKKRSPWFSSCCTRSASPQVSSNFF